MNHARLVRYRQPEVQTAAWSEPCVATVAWRFFAQPVASQSARSRVNGSKGSRRMIDELHGIEIRARLGCRR